MNTHRVLGCSRCRYSAKGCSRCMNPEFKPRTLRNPAASASTAAAVGVEGPLSARQQAGSRKRKRQGQQPAQQHLLTPLGIDTSLQQQLPDDVIQHEQRNDGPESGGGNCTHAAATDVRSSSDLAKRLRRALVGTTSATAAAGDLAGRASDDQTQQQASPPLPQCHESIIDHEQQDHHIQQQQSSGTCPQQGQSVSEQAAVLAAAANATSNQVNRPQQQQHVLPQHQQEQQEQQYQQQQQRSRGGYDYQTAANSGRIAQQLLPAPHDSSFAATLEARIKQQLSQGRRPVPSPAGKKPRRKAAQGPAGDAEVAHTAATRGVVSGTAQPASGEAEGRARESMHHGAAAAQPAAPEAVMEAAAADALAANIGALAAAVSDGSSADVSADASTPINQQQQWQPRQQQQSMHSRGKQQQVTTPYESNTSDSIDSAEGAAAAAAAAAAVSPTTPSSSKAPPTAAGKGRARRSSGPKPKPYAHLFLPGLNPREPVPGWQAPVSPFGLLEEELWQQPWQLLLGCMLLNKTSGKQVRRVFWQLLELCPTPEAAIAADTASIRDIIAPLGLHNKRAVAVQRLSHDFLHKDWTCPTELYGIGKYAADAYYMFCRGQWQGVQPDDKDLIKYHEWLSATGGQGMALAPLGDDRTATAAEGTLAAAAAAGGSR